MVSSLFCHQCNGAGMVQAVGTINCASCRGTGHLLGSACLDCNGNGQIVMNRKILCPECDGRGIAYSPQPLSLNASTHCS
jgi:DnaJ-class molecular chaperone